MSSSQNNNARATIAVGVLTAEIALATSSSSSAEGPSSLADDPTSSVYPSISGTSSQNNDRMEPTGTSTTNIASVASTSASALHPMFMTHQPLYSMLNQSIAMLGRRNFPSSQKRRRVDNKVLHLPLPAKNLVSANIPQPPNWEEHLDRVSQSLDSYKLFTVNTATVEFQKLAELLHPLHINNIDRIVNPKVWNRFVNGRMEMLKAKCSDPILLRQLGLSDAEISKKKQSLNFLRHKALDAAPYNDNFVLLFHCTRDPENIEYIQRDGFDERMSRGGLLGKGIYFSDNFETSISYDGSVGVLFVCGVLLGDCVLEPDQATSVLMKEPEKLPAERRYIDDNYFDSVKGGSNSHYAIYNRYQCYPLYKINYRLEITSGGTVISPPFVWTAEKTSHTPAGNSQWALHAKTIFDAMYGRGQLPQIWRAIPIAQESVDEKLETLKKIGYTDTNLNLRTLKENNFEMKPTMNVLVQRNIDEALKLQSQSNPENGNESESESEGSSYHSTTDDEGSPYHSSTDEDNPRPSTSQAHRSKKKPMPASDTDCSICCNAYPRKSNSWRTLPQCQHKLCVNCYKRIEITRTTMVGVAHTFLKCPFCLITSGTEIGICPNGEMTERLISSQCDGYEDYDTIMITYAVNVPVNSSAHPDVPLHSSAVAYRADRRIAYLPNNKEGQKILYLLRIAWNRRLIFTIGTSHTTGRENALVWNIHHKTSLTGGVSCHGYPDATYFDRVRAELTGFGIE